MTIETVTTEDEARKRWCCGPKIAADASFAIKRMDAKTFEPNPPDGNGMCVASACMAWRWRSMDDLAGSFVDAMQRTAVADVPPPRLPTHGYCGLAGQP